MQSGMRSNGHKLLMPPLILHLLPMRCMGRLGGNRGHLVMPIWGRHLLPPLPLKRNSSRRRMQDLWATASIRLPCGKQDSRRASKPVLKAMDL